MIRVEVRKIPKRIISVDELMVDDPTVFDFVTIKMFDFTLNR